MSVASVVNMTVAAVVNMTAAVVVNMTAAAAVVYKAVVAAVATVVDKTADVVHMPVVVVTNHYVNMFVEVVIDGAVAVVPVDTVEPDIVVASQAS